MSFPLRLVPSLRLLLAGGVGLGRALRAAAPDTANNDDTVIVVTASRSEAERDTVPTIVAVVEAEDLREEGFPVRLQDQLRSISGLTHQFNGGGFAGSGGIYLRGARSHQTQYMLDGIPFNDPTAPQGQVEPHLFTLPGLGRIEVAKGAQSGLYGSGATGGAVNLRSLQPTQTTEASVRFEYGSFQTFAGSATATGPITDELSFAIAVNGLSTDGFSAQSSFEADGDPAGFEDDAYSRFGTQGRVQWQRDDHRAYLSALLLDASEEYDAFEQPDDDTSENHLNSLRIAAGGTVPVADQVTLAADLAYTAYDREAQPSGNTFESDEYYASIRSTYRVHPTTDLTLAADWRDQAAQTADIDESASLLGVWAEAAFTREALTAQVVLRHDAHELEGDATTWRLGASYALLDDRVVVHAAHGTGFRAPSLFELYAPLYGNEELEPEETATWELGHRSQLHSTLRLEQTAFYTGFEELITYDFATMAYANIEPDDRSYVFGLENTAAWQPHPDWDIRATLTLQDSDTGGENGNEITFTPQATASLTATWSFTAWNDGFWITGGLDHRGKQWQDPDNTVELDAHTTLRATLGWQPDERIRLYLRAENITDTHTPGYLAQPRDPDTFYPGDPGSAGASFTSPPLSLAIGGEARF